MTQPTTPPTTREEYMDALFVLEVARDLIDTTDDEHAILREAHAILQEYREELAPPEEDDR